MQTVAVGWTSNEHTAEYVDLFALGPGSGRLSPYIKNNELFGVMMQAIV